MELSCNAIGSLVLLSVVSFLQGFGAVGLFYTTISTIEKRFDLTSSQIAVMSSTFDIAACITLPIVSYVGGKGYKPRWIGSGSILIGLGALMYVLPHFVAPTYSSLHENVSECELSNMTMAKCSHSHNQNYRVFFYASQVLIGIGTISMSIFTLVYLDENVQQRYSATYMGILQASGSLGPGVGYFLGGYLLNHYTYLTNDANVSRKSSSWIGNWWIGFVIGGSLIIILSIPIFFFPEKLRNIGEYAGEEETSLIGNDAKNKDEKKSLSFADAFKSFVLLLKNPSVVLLSLSNSLSSGMAIGLSTFGPKYVESVFNCSSTMSAYYIGILSLVTDSSSNVLGGIFVTKFDLTVKQMVKFCIACSALTTGFLSIYFISCKDREIEELEMKKLNMSSNLCRLSCGYAVKQYRPICAENNVTYLSYCDAGCMRIDETYRNCSDLVYFSEGSNLWNATATSGRCNGKETCSHLLPVFLVFFGIGNFISGFSNQATLQILWRSVQFEQRSFALGILSLATRILGTIPFAIIYGKIIDLSCIIWSEECGKCGSCLIHSSERMPTYILILSMSLQAASTLLLIAMIEVNAAPAKDGMELEINSTSVKTEE
ncbi:solute carrier organic anion transporter family member 4A1-like [Styela clava]